MLKKALLLATLMLPACIVQAQEPTKSPLIIDHPWSMELPPNAPTVAAYFVIRNAGPQADRLIGADSPMAGAAQLHQHISRDGLMKMQQVDAVDVPANGAVTFAPMAYHVMLLDIKDRSSLTDGKAFALTLHFQKAGDMTIQVMVHKEPPDSPPAHAH